ncbi:MAG: pilus assembly protein [Alphaproteobacteria bacterium]|nr:pilus assembly protein [Alphaproteobacteria bacterium]
MRFLKQFRKNDDGVTALEFAFVAPVLSLFVMGVIEAAMMMFVQNIIESATFNASRLGKTGFATEGATREETIRAMIDERAGGLLDAELIEIDSMAYGGGFGDINQPEPYTDSNGNGTKDGAEPYIDSNGNGQWDADMGAAGLGNAGDVVVYTVQYPWTLLTPMAGAFFGNDELDPDEDPVIVLTARAVVRNEPF